MVEREIIDNKNTPAESYKDKGLDDTLSEIFEKAEFPTEEELDKKVKNIRNKLSEKIENEKNKQVYTEITFPTVNTEKIKEFFGRTKEKVVEHKKEIGAALLSGLVFGGIGYGIGNAPVDDLQHQVGYLNNSLMEKSNQVTELQDQLSYYETSLTKTNKELSLLNSSLQTLQSENSELKQNLSSSWLLIGDLNQTLQSLEKNYTMVKNENAVLEKQVDSLNASVNDYKSIIADLFLDDKLDKNIEFLTYAVRDIRDEKQIDEAIDEMVKNGISSVIISYPGNDEHLISLKYFLRDYKSTYKKVYGEEPEINLLLEDNVVSAYRFSSVLKALENENLGYPDKIYIRDLYGLIINGRGEDALKIVKGAKARDIVIVFDVNPYYKPTKEQEKTLKKILSYNNVELTIFSMQYFDASKYKNLPDSEREKVFYEDLEKAVEAVKTLADKYHKEFIAPIIVSHEGVITEADPLYLAAYMKELKKLGVKEYIVNSWDEQNNGTPIAIQLYRRILKDD
ncbi:MAG: hypothetical protein J7K83_00750 [Candidatus Aenigmarchaeota archaeon]|nr:hypothetical protein [Candidatus Aenigmarchaeota archaeon]